MGYIRALLGIKLGISNVPAWRLHLYNEIDYLLGGKG